MFKKNIKYSQREFTITPYTTDIERDLLITNQLSDAPNLDGVLDILQPLTTQDLRVMTHDEKLNFVFQIRCLSVGEEVPVRYVCTECKNTNEDALNVSNTYTPGELQNDKFTEIPDLGEFLDKDVSELELDEYDSLLRETEEKRTKFNFIVEHRCMSCGNITKFNIGTDEYACECISEDTLPSLYQSIADLVFHGNYTKLDVDSMLPFERTMFIGLLNKTKEDLAQ